MLLSINRFKQFVKLLLIVHNISIVYSQIPRTISVQGVLSAENTLNGNVHVFLTKLIDKEYVLFSQIDTLKVERDGLFEIVLGKSKGLPESLKFDKQYFVEFTIDGIVMPMRIPLQTVPYAITSERVSENSIEIQHLSSDLKRVLNLSSQKDTDKSEQTLANYVGGLRSVIAGGDENRTSESFSSILGGNQNGVHGIYGTVTGGQSNIASGGWSFIGGGQNNRVLSSYSGVNSGRDNIITSSGLFGVISGGQSNQLGGNNAVIGGGQLNIVGATGATVSGGVSNRAMQSYSAVSGGQNNIAFGTHAVIGGGNNNSAFSQGGVVSGGFNNRAAGLFSSVGGGMNNVANGLNSVTSGGLNNVADAEYSMISGGSDNTISNGARHSFISGGLKNIIYSGMNSGIIGSNNTMNSNGFSYIVGTSNSLNSVQYSFALGSSNQVSGQNTLAIGTGNIVSFQNEVVIGSYNLNSNNPANTTNADFIGNRRFTVGIGSQSQRKNAISVFENGNTLFQGKIMSTGKAFFHSIEIENDATIGGNLNVLGNSSIIGNLQVTGTINGTNISGTNTGNVTLGTSNGLSLNNQVLSLGLASSSSAGAMSAADKSKLDGISGSGGSGYTHWIGEQFGGGVIFHLYKDNQGVEHGLILALNNQSSSQFWSNISQEIGSTSQSSWNGASNSSAIPAQAGHTNSGAKLCLDLVIGSYTDWYMPSIQELSLLWNNYFTVATSLSQIQGAQLLSTYYWSSTEYCADYAWYIDFTNGNTDYNYKSNSTFVRAIRAF